ncbi:DUF2931 family protein [Chryseobacterium wangxinyae]|uniref:DUF2931 family protein n=1 Tax=Chryseobacterium sp. CY353 TaxID=2997334 RepID=UPI002270D71B|nr:DUF2931 family protein [Chryseobacterium sp. CY353]MCY0970730.1 DUF2931 family protein [Chryseobacterium sp. CY353]
MEQDQFSYMVTVTSPKEYPTEVHIGFINDGDTYICAIPKAGVTTGSWQYDGAAAGQGGDIIPSHIDLTYVAYAEKKFYHVDAALPKDKLLAAFRKGFLVEGKIDDNGHMSMVDGTYDTFSIGLAPGGMVVIWLSGIHHKTEICRLRAKEVFVDKEEFRPTPRIDETQSQFFDTKYNILVPDSIKEEISKRSIPFGKWDNYRERFKYRFVLNPYDDKDIFTHNYYTYYNGESDELLKDELNKKEYMERGIPFECTFIFTLYNTDITFNDTEMLEVFRKLKKSHPDQPMDVIIKPTFEYDDMKVSVKSGKEEIMLTKYKVK